MRKFAYVLMVFAVSVLFAAAPAQADLVLGWSFDSTLNDSTANANNGTISSGTATYVAGKIGNAISLSPNDQTVTKTSAAGLPVNVSNAWSMSYWAEFSSAPASYWNFAGWGNAANGQLRSMTASGSNPYFFGYNADRNFGLSGGSSFGAVNTWHLYTISSPGGASPTVTFSVDGVSNSQTLSGAMATATVANVTVGGRVLGGAWGGAGFSGSIDDMAIWNTALSAGKAKTLNSVFKHNSDALNDYGASEMDLLFKAYDNNVSNAVTSNAGTLTWQKFTERQRHGRHGDLQRRRLSRLLRRHLRRGDRPGTVHGHSPRHGVAGSAGLRVEEAEVEKTVGVAVELPPQQRLPSPFWERGRG